MRKLFNLSAPLLLLLAPLSAQAKFVSYGSTCNNSAKLSVTGIPKLGKSFTVNGVKLSSVLFCTGRFCNGSCVRCNSCGGVHGFLLLGVKKISLPLTRTCVLLNSAEFIIPGSSSGQLTYTVPNNASLIGKKFYLQRADVSLYQWMGTKCPSHLRPDAIVGMSDGVEGTVGI